MTFKQLCDWAPLSSFFTKDTLSGQQYYYYYYYYYYVNRYVFRQDMRQNNYHIFASSDLDL